MDFYATCAHYWGITRLDAKSDIICMYFTKVTSDMGGGMHLDRPEVLDFIPCEARSELLAYQGVIVGDS